MITRLRRLGRAAYAVTALALVATIVVPSLTGLASAAQMQNRRIKMSSAITSATSVSYEVNFTPETSATGTYGAIVVDFCADSPLIGDTACSVPTGFHMGASPSVTINSGIGTGGTWVTTDSLQCNAATGKQVLILANATPQAPSALGSTDINFTISGITNPSSVGSFYARILSFDTEAHAVAQYTCATANQRPSSFTNMDDYGGVAMTTANTINITARVMETIYFCVTGGTTPIDDSGSTPGPCTNTGDVMTSPNITIGHGTANALDFTAVDTAPAFTEITTNAQHGYVVRMKQTNACSNGGLSTDGGTTCPIEGVNSSEAVLTAGMNNTNPGGGFAMCVHKETGSTATVSAPYDDTVNACPKAGSAPFYPFNGTSNYGLDASNTTGTRSTYGSQLFADSAEASYLEQKNTLVFAATAGLVTPAGIYQGGESLIATGTF